MLCVEEEGESASATRESAEIPPSGANPGTPREAEGMPVDVQDARSTEKSAAVTARHFFPARCEPPEFKLQFPSVSAPRYVVGHWSDILESVRLPETGNRHLC